MNAYMNDLEAEQLIKATLSQQRYEHSLRVKETAEILAARYEAPIDKVILASLLHDYAKGQTRDQLKAQIIDYNLSRDLLDYHHELWHGPVAAEIFRDKYGFEDEAVLQAIRYHTTGRAEMGLVEIIVFVADYIEPGRTIPGVEEVRKLAQDNIYLAAREAQRNTIIYLLKKNAIIHPDSFLAYNKWTNKIQGGF